MHQRVLDLASTSVHHLLKQKKERWQISNDDKLVSWRTMQERKIFEYKRRHRLRNWSMPPIVSNHPLVASQRPQPGSLTATTQVHWLTFAYFFPISSTDHLEPYPNQNLPHTSLPNEAVVLRACVKPWPTHLQRLFWRFNPRIKYPTLNLWFIHTIPSLYSSNTTKTTMFKQQKIPYIFSLFGAVGEYRPQCCYVYSASNR